MLAEWAKRFLSRPKQQIQEAPMTYSNPNVVKDPGLLARIEQVATKVTEARTKDFINSLLEFCKKADGLTRSQLGCFEKIESHFSPQAEAKAIEWEKSYNEEKRSLLVMCAKYYQHTPYNFEGIIRRILDEPSFIPTEEQFKRITANKYAQKVVAATNAPPKYPKNSLVQIRKEARGFPPALIGKLAFVIQTDSSPVQNATKGAKRYKILPFGATQSYEIEERHLKWGKAAPKSKGDNVGEGEHNV